MKILFVTSNLNKLKEVREIFKNEDIEIISLRDLNDYDDVEETGTTFEENALIKAEYFHKKYNIPVVSEDSGLCCNGINGAPGIFSARYSGKGSKENNNKLLKELIGKDRTAFYYCAVCYIDENSNVHYFNGQVNGSITEFEQGSNGFGYDPIFYSNELECTFGEASDEAKNRISHRKKGFTAFYNFIKK